MIKFQIKIIIDKKGFKKRTQPLKGLLSKVISTLGIILSVLVLSTIIGLGIHLVFAWTGPSADPPGGNIATPINVSSTAQTKAGDLTLGDDLTVAGAVTAYGFRGGGNRVTFTAASQVTTGYLDFNGNSTAISVPQNTGYLNVFEYGSWDSLLRVEATGKVDILDQLCIRGVCRTDWPSGGGGIACADCDSRFVNLAGDTMTGALKIPGGNKKFEIDSSSGIFMYTNELNTKAGPLYLQHTSGGSGDAGTSVEVGHDLNVAGSINTFRLDVNDLRADIMYDLSNTGYYVNPSATSKFNSVELAGNLKVENNSWGTGWYSYDLKPFNRNHYLSCPNGSYVRGFTTHDNGKIRYFYCAKL